MTVGVWIDLGTHSSGEFSEAVGVVDGLRTRWMFHYEFLLGLLGCFRLDYFRLGCNGCFRFG